MNTTVKNTYILIALLVLIMISGCVSILRRQEPTDRPNKESQKTWGYITVHSLPSNASVYLDNSYIGDTPVDRLKKKSGLYRLEVTKNGYDSYKEIITVGDGKETKCDIILNEQ